ncbi:MAG: hypothetical protein M3246_07530 [Actinomycetota bacterium]|nr:hypothetical protein [Actinomycetota bacterium]
MIIHGVNGEDLYHALSIANYACRGNLAFDEEPIPITEQQQRSWRVSLTVKDLEGPGCRRQPCAWLPERGIRGVCFHACSAYIVALFERAPTARIVVADTYYYEGVDHFYAKLFKARGTLSPQYSAQACNCRKFYDNPEEALIPDVRICGDWRAGKKLYQGLELG